jgi:hypothetical protein
VQKDWVPASAALLVTGALALALASILTPTGSSDADTLRLVQQHDGRWLAAAATYFIASVALTLGLPSVLTLFRSGGRRIALGSTVALATGFVGVAGYAMLIVFFRAMVVTDAIRDQAFDELVHEAGLEAFLYAWIAAFYLGELLLAIALLRSDEPRWIPTLLILHVLSLPVGAMLDDSVSKVLVFLMVFGFSGLGIRAAEPVRGA